MPQGFVSTRQIQTCFGKKLSAEAKGKKFTWDCEKELRETPNVRCLPTIVKLARSGKCSSKKINQTKKIIPPLYKGSRGGVYFYPGSLSIKTYVPPDARSYAITKYGPAKRR